MKKNIILYLAAVAGMALAGCNKESAAPEVSGEIRVTAGIGNLTKVAYDGSKSAFEKGDGISVYAWMGNDQEVPAKLVVNGVVNTFDGKVWTPEVQMLWKTVVDPHYFIGVYPARQVNDFKSDTYEQMPLDYELSDLLIATNVSGVKASDGPVSLVFDHAMAKLQVNLNFRSEWNSVPALNNVSVSVNAVTVGTINYLKKEIAPALEGEVKTLPLKSLEAAATGYTYSFSNLIIPQEGIREIAVKVDGRTFIYTHTANEKGLSLEKGKVNTINLKVGREQLELEGISVDDWNEGAMPAEDGEAGIPVTGLSFKQGVSGTIPFGGTLKLTPIFAPYDATFTDCVWESLAPEIAQVDENGLISALFQGKATIKCTCGTQEALFELFVEPKAGTLVAQASANSTTVSFINRATGPVYYMTSNGVAGVIEAGKTGDISLNAGAKVWFYGDNAAYGNGTPEGSSSISMDKDCLVSGNLMSLVDAANFETATLTEPDAFSYFFSGESHLKNDASNPIVLSAPNLTPGCYKGLFEGCSGLKAIDVKATDISASGATDGWLDGVSSSGNFVTPKPSQWCSGGNLPESWTVYEPSAEGSVLAQQAPAVGEGKAGTTINPISGIDAHDGSIHIDSPADLAYSTDGGATWTDVPASGDITGLGLGKVLVHKKAAEPLDASPYVSISLKSVPAYTAPVAKSGLVYSSSAQNLVTAGSTSEGTTMEYKVGSGSWSSSLPTGTNAGNYTVYWRIKGNAQYVDVPESSLGTINIAKKAPSFSVNPTSVSFSSTDNVNATKTATITYDGDGTLSASSNNTGMATVSRNNKTLTITRKSADGGSVTITVSAAAGTNYSAATNQTITVSLTSADLGTYLQNAVAGDKVGSNGKVYKPNATMPTGVTVVGCVVRPGVVFKASDEPGHLTESQLYNYKVSAGKFHYHSMNDLWDRYWEIKSVYLYNKILIDKDNTGQSQATATAALNQVNSYLQAAGCDPINVNRYYGTNDGWFYKPQSLNYQYDSDWWHDNMNYTISARPVFTYDTN